MKSFAFVSIGIALPFLLAGGAQAQFGTPSGILSGLDRPTVHPPIDMDNDGDLDLVLQDDTGKVAFWLENTDGQGNFILADTFGTGLPINAKIAMGDLFLDGYPDMVVAVNDTIRYREQNTLGQWSAPALVQGGVNVTVVRIADMTGDTLPEVVTLRGTPFDLIWYHNTATPPFSTSTTLGITGGPAPGDLDIADLNGDGFRDAFCMNWNGNGVAALSLDALGTQWEVDTLFSGLYLDQAEVLDLDGDGDMDIAKRNGIGVQWMRNNGNGTFPDFSQEYLQGSQWSYDHAFGNFGCGGGTEVFWSTGTPEQFKWSSWSDALDDLTPAAVLDQLPSSQMSVLQVGDLNGDGLDDIIVQQADSLYWMPSLPTVQPLPVIAPELDTLCGSSGTYVLPAGGEWWFDGYVTQAIPAGQVVGTTDTLVFLVEDSAGCVSADHATLTHVLEASMVGPFQGDPLCTYDEPVQLQGFPSGGAWSPPVDGSGLFDPGTTGPGSHPITFTYVDPTGNACQASEPLEVWASAFAALTPAGPFCEDDTLQLITATFGIYGGLFLDTLVTLVDSIPPIMTAAFDPGIGAGSYPIIVSGIGPMSCPGYDTLVVTVLPLPEVLVGPADTTLCLNTTLQQLPVGDPPGGSWTGPFIQPDGTLVTTDLGLGAHTAYYTYTDGNGCSGLDSLQVLVDICNGIGPDGRNGPGAWWDPMTGSVVLDADQWPYGDWQLFDGRGSLMAEGAIQGQGIPLGHWLARSGVYHVRLIDRGRARTIRFVY